MLDLNVTVKQVKATLRLRINIGIYNTGAVHVYCLRKMPYWHTSICITCILIY